MDSEQTLRRPILRHYIIPRRYVKFNRKTRLPQRKRGSAGENRVPAAETGAQEVLFSAGQGRVVPRRGGCDTILPIWADGFAGITAWCRSADDPRGTTLTQAFYIPGDQEVVLDYKDGLYTILRKIRRPHFGAVRRRVHGACPHLSRTALFQRV